MSDDERQILIRKFASGETDILPKIQRLNDRLGLGLADAEYFQEYMALNEKFLSRTLDRANFPTYEAAAMDALRGLNEKYQTLVTSKTLRAELMGLELSRESDQEDDWSPSESYDDEDAEDSWAPSQIC